MAKRKRRPANRTKLDIIIPVYGQLELLKKCIASIDTPTSYQLIIVDDQSHGLRSHRNYYGTLENVRMVYHQQNLGFARSVNDGINKGNSELVLILNSDIELLPGAIDAMLKEFDEPSVGVVGPKLLFPPDSTDPHRPANKIQHAGMCVDYKGRILHANIGWSHNHPKTNKKRELQAVTGACLMTRRSVAKQIHQAYKANGDNTTGPFNEVYGRGTFEDIEYCFATRSFGHKVIYTPEAIGYHHVGASIKDEGYPIQRNELIFRARVGEMLAWDEWRYL